jgi:hypothetical protein
MPESGSGSRWASDPDNFLHAPVAPTLLRCFKALAFRNLKSFMLRRLCFFLIGFCSASSVALRADTPAVLGVAIERWTAAQEDWAFTQQTRSFLEDGTVKDERIERYDPSLPDDRRWRLVEVNGQPATDAQRKKWESRKNGKPRTKVSEAPSKYLNLEHATLIGETPKDARFRVPLRPEAQRLLNVKDIEVVITVDKQSGSIASVGAALREPIRVLLGLAQITDLDVDFRVNPVDEGSSSAPDEVLPGSTARVMISKLGKPVEYNWTDFKRVTAFAGP